jgi:hypothetical protein
LAAADLTQLGETPITILSNFYPNIYVRMDATGVNAASPTGGTVNCEYGIDSRAQFKIRPQNDGTYAFESAASPGVFLRMDATGTPTDMSAGGTVNCQFGIVDAKERFNAYANADGSFSFESAALPTYYLRLVTGSGVTTATGPGGTVNCQYNAKGGANESFFLNMADQALVFAMQQQTQQMWCWDATAVSVANYYNPNSGWTQCTLANTVFARQDCCNLDANGVSTCNWGCWPDQSSLSPNPTGAPGPMQAVGHYTQTLTCALSPVQLGVQMAKSAPVVCNISWRGGGGHIVVVKGRSLVSGVDHVSVSDPAIGDSDQVYNTFKTAYQVTGTWDHSYPTA